MKNKNSSNDSIVNPASSEESVSDTSSVDTGDAGQSEDLLEKYGDLNLVSDSNENTGSEGNTVSDDDSVSGYEFADESKPNRFKALFMKKPAKPKKTWRQRSVIERLIALIPSVFIIGFIVATPILYDKTEVYEPYTFYCSVGFAILSVLIGVFCIRLGKVFGWIVTALTPGAAFLLTEFFTHSPFEMERRFIIVNLFIYYLIAAVVLFITGSQKAAVAFSVGLPMLFGITNYYVLQFRGTPFFPWDIASAGIAADVVGNYEVVIPWHVTFIMCAFVFMLQLGFICTPRIRLHLWWLRAPMSIVTVVALVLLSTYIQDKGPTDLKMYPHLFSPKHVYKVNGAGVTFVYTLQFSGLDEPDGYSPEKLSDMLDEYEAETLAEGEKLPNVIIIMNEAFSDLKTMVNYRQSMPVTPYIDSMIKDTVKGTVHVSVKGGNTPNSEFEFLTGISMANMTPGSIPYQQHIKGETPTLVKQVSELGYRTVGMHPYGATGWKRNQVYEWFGFDETYFSQDFAYAERIRSYYSDRATYKKIIDIYLNKEQDQPLFVFDVTMQNHGGYAADNNGTFVPQAYATGLPSTYYVNTYLSLIKESDQAFGELVEFFKTQDEPTVILMFGDHQPHDGYVASLLNYYNVKIESGSIDEQLRRYTVPFVMWANYDIVEGSGIDTSLNYLSSLLFEKAEIPRSSTQMYLSALSEKYPVVTEGHYQTADGIYHSAADIPNIKELTEYKMLSYNMIADRKNTLDKIYSYK